MPCPPRVTGLPPTKARIELVLICPAPHGLILLDQVWAAMGAKDCIQRQHVRLAFPNTQTACADSCRGLLACHSPEEIALMPVPLFRSFRLKPGGALAKAAFTPNL